MFIVDVLMFVNNVINIESVAMEAQQRPLCIVTIHMSLPTK
jgi:hypothetical protein